MGEKGEGREEGRERRGGGEEGDGMEVRKSRKRRGMENEAGSINCFESVTNLHVLGASRTSW